MLAGKPLLPRFVGFRVFTGSRGRPVAVWITSESERKSNPRPEVHAMPETPIPTPRRHRDPCADKAHADEPIFTLRAQDQLAPEMVREWADRAKAAGSPPTKVDEALRIANEMERWQGLNHAKVPD